MATVDSREVGELRGRRSHFLMFWALVENENENEKSFWGFGENKNEKWVFVSCELRLTLTDLMRASGQESGNGSWNVYGLDAPPILQLGFQP